MDLSKNDFKQHVKIINGVEVQPLFACASFDGNVYKDFVITKTADEVYNELLNNTNNIQQGAQDTLNAQLLKANAEIATQLDNQKTLNAQLLLDIAKLKGGN